jgi:sec-independent protein translocase protein TatC
MSFLQNIVSFLIKKRKESKPETAEMSFLEHLEELRWDVVKIVIGVIIATALAAVFAKEIVNDLLLRPLLKTGLKAQVLTPYGIVMLYMEASLFTGIVISMPNTLFWLWRFISPGLMRNERKYVLGILFFTSLCFFAGIAFGYYILLPAALTFFASFGTETIELNIAIDRYVSFVLAMILGSGLVFELPMISYFLSKMGILTPKFMRRYRRHAIVIILIIAAIVTPTPDIVTQILLALPMFILYEVSIFISYFVSKPKNEDEQSDTADKENSNTKEESSS